MYGDFGLGAMLLFLLAIIAALILALIWALTSFKVVLICAAVVGLFALGFWLGVKFA